MLEYYERYWYTNYIEMDQSEEPLDLRTGCSSSSEVLKSYENKHEHYVKRRPTYLELEFGRFVRRLTHQLLDPDLSITQQSQEHLTQIEEACKTSFPQFDSRQIRLKIRAQLKLYRRNLNKVNKNISTSDQSTLSLKSTVISSLASLSSTNHLIPSDKVVFQQQSNTSLSSNFNDQFNRSPVNSELINFIQQMSEEYKCEAKKKERSKNTSKNDDNVQQFKFKDNLSTKCDIVGLVTAPDAFTGKLTSSNSTSNSSMLNILYPVSGNTDSMISKMELNQINAASNTSVDNKNDNNINMINTGYVYLPNNSISNIPLIYPMSFTQPSLIYHLKHNESNPINSTCATDLSDTTKYLEPAVSNITTGIVSMSSTTTPLSVFSTPNTISSLLALSLRASANHLIQTARLYKMFIQPIQSINDNHQLSILNSQYINNIFHGINHPPELEDLTNIPLNLEHKLSKTNLQPK
ncbi:unnamed protein product [Schistosoma margrebowiei]|uniref:Uncharacterized protein n=1 Tax=Schistosoma margrebowiei TaxID=48269 RepID=A0AA84Z7T3_9TREM|nr:unnamed protein product [Schistosoma margrebowiei]